MIKSEGFYQLIQKSVNTLIKLNYYLCKTVLLWIFHKRDVQFFFQFFNSPYHRPRRPSIIQPYDAIKDRHSAGYFRSPMVKEVMSRTVSAQVRENWQTYDVIDL